MATARRRKREGPRQAVRWIGDAFVLPGDLQRGASAVWRGPAPAVDPNAAGVVAGRRAPQRDARLACVRVVEMLMDWEFGPDDLPTQRAAAAAAGPGLVPRIATYRNEDDVAVVEEDVADLSLADVMAALRDAEGTPPLGLALYVGASLARACRTAEACKVELELSPSDVFVAWDGALYCRPILREREDEDIEYADDPLEAAAYHTEPRRIVGLVMHALANGGKHAFINDDDVDDEEPWALAEEVAQRVRHDEPPPLDIDGPRDVLECIAALSSREPTLPASVRALLEPALPEPPAPAKKKSAKGAAAKPKARPANALTAALADAAADGETALAQAAARAAAQAAEREGPAATWDDITRVLEQLALRERFGAAELAGMLRGLLEDKHRAALVEREERLTVMPGPRVEQEPWALFDADGIEPEDEWGVLDLDDVRKGHPDFDGIKYEPSVDAVDPFDREDEGGGGER